MPGQLAPPLATISSGPPPRSHTRAFGEGMEVRVRRAATAEVV